MYQCLFLISVWRTTVVISRGFRFVAMKVCLQDPSGKVSMHVCCSSFVKFWLWKGGEISPSCAFFFFVVILILDGVN